MSTARFDNLGKGAHGGAGMPESGAGRGPAGRSAIVMGGRDVGKAPPPQTHRIRALPLCILLALLFLCAFLLLLFLLALVRALRSKRTEFGVMFPPGEGWGTLGGSASQTRHARACPYVSLLPFAFPFAFPLHLKGAISVNSISFIPGSVTAPGAFRWRRASGYTEKSGSQGCSADS